MNDLISRQAAIDALEKVAELFPWRVPGNRDTYDRYNEAWNDAMGRAEIEIEELPSAQPERKKGRWIVKEIGCKLTSYKCSECGRYITNDTGYDVKEDYPFCHCGADMRGEQDDKR